MPNYVPVTPISTYCSIKFKVTGTVPHRERKPMVMWTQIVVCMVPSKLTDKSVNFLLPNWL